MAKMILHVTSKEDWLRCEDETLYTPLAFANGGFIHACLPNQLSGVLERYFSGRRDLLLLHIDDKRLNASVVMETAMPGGEQFPHIYGPINREAIAKLEQILPGNS